MSDLSFKATGVDLDEAVDGDEDWGGSEDKNFDYLNFLPHNHNTNEEGVDSYDSFSFTVNELLSIPLPNKNEEGDDGSRSTPYSPPPSASAHLAGLVKTFIPEPMNAVFPQYVENGHLQQYPSNGFIGNTPETSCNTIDICAQASDCGDYYNNCFSTRTHEAPIIQLASSSSDHGTFGSTGVIVHLPFTDYDCEKYSATENYSTSPCEFVADANHYSNNTHAAYGIYSGNEGNEPEYDGCKFQSKMELDSSTDVMIAPTTVDMLQRRTDHGIVFMKKHTHAADGGFLCKEKVQDSIIIGGNSCTLSSAEPHILSLSKWSNICHDQLNDFRDTDVMLEANKDYMTSGCSTGDSCNGPLSDGAAVHAIPNQYMQHFSSNSITDSISSGDKRDGELCDSWEIHKKIRTNVLAEDKQFAILPPLMPIMNSNFKHPFNTYSSSIIIDRDKSFGNCHGLVGDTHSKQAITNSYSMDKFGNGLLASCQYPINDVTQMSSPHENSVVDEDDDVCIINNGNPPQIATKPHVQASAFCSPEGYSESLYTGESASRLWAYDEKLTYRMALQDLSQPKSEATLPDGVLTVPLLRHQRIALSWMMQKETSGLNCSGGILADDQGLGKTVSTIALILAERPSVTKEVVIETLSLDDGGEGSEINKTRQPRNNLTMYSKSMRCDSALAFVKGRPAGGTLVVCPTSVLRQWAGELMNKVCSKVNLSYLVYHGSNRTKDPNELSKYDVILTTYSIVTTEVQMTMSTGKDDEDKRNSEPSVGSTKKRKNPPSKESKNLKGRTTADKILSESIACPLARVAWFRVILDEAQTIKNHKTQVSKACCELRAKRRWCLSGTPIQNAIDDLYSYFRFLKYEPYAVYSSFLANIKNPISRNPTVGYKKLQAILKTIMLRRTKGTCIDDEPIIKLPPKTIMLKKVEFSPEERSFYSKLEDESREQFKVYAAAGTVKQNYVNILLMLLQLRQACGHPHLVRRNDSISVWMESSESAKLLPMDKKLQLLNCLEACSAICTICDDPPEDALVTICGHVFCSQCIRQHITRDDSRCPSPRCKVKLDSTFVFPKDSLKSSNIFSSDSFLNIPSVSEAFKNTDCSDSSKIRAAVEILQSLPRLHDSSAISNSNGNAPSFIPDTQQSLSEHNSCGHTTEKAIVFSQWTRMLDLLELRLKSSCLQYRRLDGTMAIAARDKAVKDFNTLPEVTVIILSLKAASLGLNMVSACHVILLDLWWNPTTEDQAIDRAHRIGQTHPVTVSRLIVKDTVEDRILDLQERKRQMVASAFGEDEKSNRQTHLTVEDLKYLFMI